MWTMRSDSTALNRSDEIEKGPNECEILLLKSCTR
jgi:hypothetical protein